MGSTPGIKVGRLIRVARTGAGVSQLELAHELGVHVSTVRRLESGWRLPTAVEISAIVKAVEAETAWAERLLGLSRNGHRNGGGGAA